MAFFKEYSVPYPNEHNALEDIMAKYRILVIDDARVIRLSVKSIFEKLDSEVVELGNVEDLFQSSWKYQNLDLLFLDIDLPGMDGLTALEKIKQSPALAKVPIIMLTGHADPQMVRKAINAGILDYVRKPFTKETLLRRAGSILNLTESAIESLPEPQQEMKETSTAPAFYAVLTLSASDEIPAEVSSLLQPPFWSGLKQVGSATLVIPFQFSGTQEAATEAIRDHLQQQNWPVDQCTVTSEPPFSE